MFALPLGSGAVAGTNYAIDTAALARRLGFSRVVTNSIDVTRPQGAFYAYPDVSAAFRNGIGSPLQFAEKLLAEQFVAVVPGEAFGSKNHIRISYATSMKELERGLDRLERFIAARV